MEALKIVPWQPEHAAVLAEVLEPPDELTRQVRDVSSGDLDGPRWRRTLVAERGGDPVGVSAVFASRWHPARLWASVEVAPGHRRAGVGTALLAAARDLCSHDGRPLRGKVFAGSPGAHFARAAGFRVLQRSRTFRLPVASPSSGSRSQSGVAKGSPRNRVSAPAAFVTDTSPAPDAIAEAFRDFYVRSHVWDPPGALTAADFRASHVNEAVAAFLVLGPDSSALAVGCLYDDEDGLLLSGGPTAPDDERARPATAALLDAALAHAKRWSRHELLVEADDFPPPLSAELDRRGAAVLDETHVVAER